MRPIRLPGSARSMGTLWKFWYFRVSDLNEGLCAQSRGRQLSDKLS